MSLVASININLLVPVLILFLLMRTQSIFNPALRLLSGLKFFALSRYAAVFPRKKAPTPASETVPGEDIIDKSISKLGLAMVELGDNMPTAYLLKTQLFFDLYEALVNITMAAFLTYIWSMGHQCAVPVTIAPSCWLALPSILLLILACFCYQCLMQILYLTGWRAKECKIACLVGFWVFVGCLVFFFLDVGFVSGDIVFALAQHTNAMIAQLSSEAPQLSMSTLVPLVQVTLSSATALLAAGLVIPSIRFTQTLHDISFGKRTALTTSAAKIGLWVDFAFPMVVCLLFSSLPEMLVELVLSRMMPDHMGGAYNADATGITTNDQQQTCSTVGDNTCKNVVFVQQLVVLCAHLLFLVRWGSVLALVALRLASMQYHLQSFLDSLVAVVAAQIIGSPADTYDPSELQAKIRACTEYLAAAATQYLCAPVMLLALALLMHKSSATGTGMCEAVYDLARVNRTDLMGSMGYMREFNSTSVAVQQASAPYFMDAVATLAGATLSSSRNSSTTAAGTATATEAASALAAETTKKLSGKAAKAAAKAAAEAVAAATAAAVMAAEEAVVTPFSRMDMMQKFILKLSQVYALPSGTAVSLAQSAIFMTCFLMFFLSLVAIILWKVSPTVLFQSTGSSSSSSNSSSNSSSDSSSSNSSSDSSSSNSSSDSSSSNSSSSSNGKKP